MIGNFNDKYRIPPARLAGYDYGSNGFYFVSIGIKNYVHYFDHIPPAETDYYPSLHTEHCVTNNDPSENIVRSWHQIFSQFAGNYDLKQIHIYF